MENNENNGNLFQQISRWIRESVTLKLAVLVFLVLLLLIPSAWIQGVIDDRQSYSYEATEDITRKWSDEQTLTGPVLVIPFTRTYPVGNEPKTGEEVMRTAEDRLILLPEKMTANAALDPQTLKRGIFDVNVYSSEISMHASFSPPDWSRYDIDPQRIDWRKAYLAVGISDMRGMYADPVCSLNKETYTAEAYSGLPEMGDSYSSPFANGIRIRLEDSAARAAFDCDIQIGLKGSRSFFMLASGQNSSIEMTGNWPDPSFSGYFLPDDRDVTDSGFTASWNILKFTRPLPEAWISNIPDIENTGVGVELMSAVNDYQRTSRTSKYGALIIIFTFLGLFLTELISRIRVHPFQYVLIGVALVIDYTLLLSISEQLGFNTAYLISSLATTALIALYTRSFSSWRVTGLLAALLVIFYTFIYIIINQQDYALLLGSFGLFVAVGALMFLTRKVNWYGKEL